MRCKFVSVGQSYGAANGIRIPRSGYETESEQEIEFFRKSPDFGNFFYEIPRMEAVKKNVIEDAKKVLAENGLMPAIERMSVPNLAAEEAAFQAEEEAKQADADLEAAIKAEKVAKEAEIQKKRAAARVKKSVGGKK